MPTVKIWRLSFLSSRKGSKVMTFLTVKDALDHVRLLNIDRFHLEDRTDRSAKAH